VDWLLEQTLADCFERPLPQLTHRDAWWPQLKGKAVAVLGMRRSGKTCLLWQRVREGLERGLPWRSSGALRAGRCGAACFWMKSS
jgi:predicted AAA+ superfamily ATPase